MHSADLLTDRSRLTPHREALLELDSGRRFSYADLNARACRLANFMTSLGVQAGDRVSILAHNSVVYLDLFYGLAKIGAIFTPLNWRLTAAELSFIVGDCTPKVMLVGPEFSGVWAEMQPSVDVGRVISLDGADVAGALSYDDGLAAAAPEEPARPALDGESPYCILYTSGTTGKPKGAVLPHRQILWNCINTVTSWGLSERDVSPVLTPLFHAGGLFAFLTPLLYAGGRIILAKGFDAEQSLRMIQEEGLEARFARHRAHAELFWAGLEEMDLGLHVEPQHRLPTLTTVRVPAGVDEVAVRKTLLERYNVEVGGGLGALKGQVWRVGLMGYSSQRKNVAMLLAALREILGR